MHSRCFHALSLIWKSHELTSASDIPKCFAGLSSDYPNIPGKLWPSAFRPLIQHLSWFSSPNPKIPRLPQAHSLLKVPKVGSTQTNTRKCKIIGFFLVNVIEPSTFPLICQFRIGTFISRPSYIVALPPMPGSLYRSSFGPRSLAPKLCLSLFTFAYESPKLFPLGVVYLIRLDLTLLDSCVITVTMMSMVTIILLRNKPFECNNEGKHDENSVGCKARLSKNPWKTCLFQNSWERCHTDEFGALSYARYCLHKMPSYLDLLSDFGTRCFSGSLESQTYSCTAYSARGLSLRSRTLEGRLSFYWLFLWYSIAEIRNQLYFGIWAFLQRCSHYSDRPA